MQQRALNAKRGTANPAQELSDKMRAGLGRGPCAQRTRDCKKRKLIVQGSVATKHVLNNSHRSTRGSLDPFEYRPDKNGRMKKHKYIPTYIPAHDAEILAQVRKWAYRLDVKMSFLGMRFGWAAVIGSIPEISDALPPRIAQASRRRYRSAMLLSIGCLARVCRGFTDMRWFCRPHPNQKLLYYFNECCLIHT